MPRICSREGCGKRLIAKDGSADYRRHFCSPECKGIDKKEKMQLKRPQLKAGKCPTCHRIGSSSS